MSRDLVAKHCTTHIPVTWTNSESFSIMEGHRPDSQHEEDSMHEEQGGLASPNSSKLFVWSASDEAGLKRLSEAFVNHLSILGSTNHNELYLQNLAYTLSVRRSSLPWKSFTVADSMSELSKNLQTKLSRPVRSTTHHPSIGFVFTGQGAQWHAMGRELMRYPIFSSSLQQADSYLQGLHCQWSLLGWHSVAPFAKILSKYRDAG